MGSALVTGSGGPGALCSWARYFTLIVSLSSQVYKWVPANLRLGVTPIQGRVEILHATETGINSGLMDNLARIYADFTYLVL